MKICVIFTGGTIGSSLNEGYVGLSESSGNALIDGYYRMCGEQNPDTTMPMQETAANSAENSYEDQVVFTQLHPVDMLSENVSVSNIEEIIRSIRKAIDSGEYQGIIVTHGTDTLSFTANVLSQVFAKAPIPIVLVSALLPLEDPRTNGFVNFKGAVDFIREYRRYFKVSSARGGMQLPESVACEGQRRDEMQQPACACESNIHVKPRVFVSFKNGDQACLIHDAAYLLSADEVTGHMHSLENMYFGTMVDGFFKLNESYEILGGVYGLQRTVPVYEKYYEMFYEKGLLSSEMVTIRSRALLNFDYFRFEENCKPKALLIELYHSGTLCSAGDEVNALKFIEYCRQKDIIVIIGPVKRGDNVYASMKTVTDQCIIAYDQSFELAMARTALALGAGAGYEEFKILFG